MDITLSDHYPIYGVMHGPATHSNKHRIITTRSWDDNKVNAFLADLKHAPWSLVDSFDNVDSMCSVWESLMKSLVGQHFPLKRKRIRRQTHPWLDSTTLKLMRTRDQMHKKAKRPGLSQDWNEYRRLRNKVTEINRKARKGYFRNKLEENRGKPKAFWDALRLVLPSKKNCNEIDCNEIERLVVDGEELSDKRDIANSLNEYFTTIASSLLASHQSHEYLAAPQQENDPVISNNTFKFRVLNEDDVFNVLQTMDISKATGADNISAKVLKTAAPYISNVVSNIFNACYISTARVTPLFKGGSKTDRDNRRPISVLPCISKAQEMFANLDLQEFAAENNLIGDHQFAYARNSSTTAALIITVDSWKFAIDKGEKVVCTSPTILEKN